MEPRTIHALELALATIGQTILLAAAWGFLSAVFVEDPLYVSDSLAHLMYSRPTETTWVVTLAATVVSVMTTTFLSIAFKEALRHRMQKPVSLIHLSSGVALARGSILFNVRHLMPTFVTLAVFGVTKLLVSSWTALLAPTFVMWTVDASGSELDLTSSWFELGLQQELVQTGAALVRGNSTQILNLDGVLSGIAAAQYTLGESGVFDFNGAKYNISTGGILPTAPGYGGSTRPVSNSNTGLAFAGGLVPVNLTLKFAEGQTIQGLNHSFNLQQQGFTANVTCRLADTSSATENLNLDTSYISMPVPFANGSTAYWLWAWNVTGNCNEGRPSEQQFVTRSRSPTVPETSSNGLMAAVVCPYPLRQTGFSWQNFSVLTNSSWRYDFLPPMICTISPVITTSLVSYADGVINTNVVNSQPLGFGNTNLTQFLAALVDYQLRTAQSLTTNSIGDALYSIHVSLSNSTSEEDLINILLWEMEQYWRGVVEFTGTFLRSAFSVYPRAIPTDARIPLSGQETITSMGWYRRTATWGYTIIPITIVALMIYVAVGYTLWHVFVIERRDQRYFTRFDPSNPIHLMMVSSARDPNAEEDSLGDYLVGFNEIQSNEILQVELKDVRGSDRKRFGVPVNDAGAAAAPLLPRSGHWKPLE